MVVMANGKVTCARSVKYEKVSKGGKKWLRWLLLLLQSSLQLLVSGLERMEVTQEVPNVTVSKYQGVCSQAV